MTFNYAGGKSKLTNQIIKHFPKHEVYIEPFGGSAKILFAKNPSRLEVYNDIDEGLSAIFICLANPRLRRELISKIEETLPSRKLFDQLRKQKPRTYVMRAFRKLYLLYYSYGKESIFGPGCSLQNKKPVAVKRVLKYMGASPG